MRKGERSLVERFPGFVFDGVPLFLWSLSVNAGADYSPPVRVDADKASPDCIRHYCKHWTHVSIVFQCIMLPIHFSHNYYIFLCV
jgi:hypothetical protein